MPWTKLVYLFREEGNNVASHAPKVMLGTAIELERHASWTRKEPVLFVQSAPI